MSTAGAVVGLTGATGHIGGLVLRRLLDDPTVAEVRSVARRPLAPLCAVDQQGQAVDQRRQSADDGARPRARLAHTIADLCDPAVRQALAGVDVLYHLAAQVWEGRGRTGRDAMYAANVEGTRNVLQARPASIVLASSAAVYGAWPDNPLPLDEDHPVRPNAECHYAVHKLLAEGLCAQEADRWAVVRLAAVLGPHADARVARSVRGFRHAVPAVRGVPQAVQWLDERDAAAGLLAVGRGLLGDYRSGQVAGQIFNVAPRDWLGARQAARLAGSCVLEVPRWALVAGSELGRRLNLTPFGADRAALIGGPLALSPAKSERLLGWKPARSSAEVFASALGRAPAVVPR
jgi:nucleoside-diphosphate-sugar epimerase